MAYCGTVGDVVVSVIVDLGDSLDVLFVLEFLELGLKDVLFHSYPYITMTALQY